MNYEINKQQYSKYFIHFKFLQTTLSKYEIHIYSLKKKKALLHSKVYLILNTLLRNV
jgi:hypothetical protein